MNSHSSRNPSVGIDDSVETQWVWQKQLPFLLLGLIVCALMYVAVARLQNWYDPPLDQYTDLNIRIPKALQHLNPQLFPDDRAIAPGSRDDLVHRELFVLLLSRSIVIFGGFRVPLIVMSIVLTIVFAGGVYLLAWYVGRDSLGAAVAAMLATGNFQAWGGVSLGFAPRQVLPRNFVVALAPALLLGLLRWRGSRRLWVLFAVLGIFANLHIIAAFHLCWIFLAAVLLTSRSFSKGLVEVLILGSVALAFASPAAWAFLPMAGGNVAVHETTAARIAERHWFEVTVSWTQVAQMLIVLAPYAALAAAGTLVTLRTPSPVRRARWKLYGAAAAVAFLLPLLGLVINGFTLHLRVLSLLRVSRYYYFFCLAPSALFISNWMRRGKRSLMVLASVCLAVLLLLGVPGMPRLLLQDRPGASEGEWPVWDWPGFRDMCEWISMTTPVDARFLIPTDWGVFRAYAERSPVSDWKGAHNQFYEAVTELYRDPDPEAFARLADEAEADYVITKVDTDVVGLERVYSNAVYQVLAVP